MAGTEEKKGGPLDMIKNMVFQWPLSVKIGVGVAIAVIIIVAVLVNGHNAQFKMVPLYSKDISAEDVEEIKLQLTKMGFKEGEHFEVVKGEKVSYLQAQTVLRGQMISKLADLGLPREVMVTSSTMKSGGFTQTEDERKLSNLHALEGDLATTIMEMDGINRTRVKIVPQKEALFVNDAEPSKATVMISTQDGYSVTKPQIQGIVNLVVGSVEGLKPENVKVVDTRGFTLSDLITPQQDEFGVPTSSAQQDRQKEFEKTLMGGTQQMLDKTLGEGNAYVEVRATLNFDQKEQKMTVFGGPGGGSGAPVSMSNDSTSSGEQGYITIGGRTVGVNQAAGFQPVSGDQLVPSSNGGHVVSYQIDSETYKNGGKGDNGVKPTGGDSSKASDYDHTVTQVNIENDTHETRIITAPGGVDRLSVALMLNGIPADRVDGIKNAVAASVGLDPSRGDVISVTNFPFKRDDYAQMRDEMLSAPAPVAKNSAMSFQVPAVNKAVLAFGGGAIVLLILIVCALFLAKQNKSNKEKAQLHLTVGPGSSINPISDLLSDKSGRTVAPSATTTVSVDQLTRMAKEKPSKVAELLKTSWMAEK